MVAMIYPDFACLRPADYLTAVRNYVRVSLANLRQPCSYFDSARLYCRLRLLVSEPVRLGLMRHDESQIVETSMTEQKIRWAQEPRRPQKVDVWEISTSLSPL